MARLLSLLLIGGLLAACVSTTTQLASVSPEAVEAEEALQRELVVAELDAEQQRLDDLAFELLAAATPSAPSASHPASVCPSPRSARTRTSGPWRRVRRSGSRIPSP